MPIHSKPHLVHVNADLDPRSKNLSGHYSASEAWLSGQRRAYEAAMMDMPLPMSLGILVETATNALGDGARAAFYVADDRGVQHHLIGMPEVDADLTGISGDTASIAQPWMRAAEVLGYHCAWSFPLRTPHGPTVGTFAVFFQQPRETTTANHEHIGLLTQAAAVIIARSKDAEERRRVEHSLRETQQQLETELEDSELLRQLSLELADEDDELALYRKLVGAAAKIMHSDVCTVQLFHPERGPAGELQMLASVGLNEDGVRYWEWVRGDSGCTCGEVLRTGKRAIAEDVESCSFMAGTPDRDVLLGGGIRAGQSTPLMNRDGKLVGMISTHWGRPHRPSDRDLRMLDLLARPAADLIERKRTAETQRLLLNELNHRVKNTLAVVQAMAQRTLARTSEPKEFAKAFGGRVQSLARIHNLLSAKSWQGADMRDLVIDQVSGGSADETRLVATGPALRLDSQAALHLALILHELGTNATKYGALSVQTGKVAVAWKVADDKLHIEWTETGGPLIIPSDNRGFGSTLITQSARGQGGEAVMEARPEGIRWTIIVPHACGSKDKERLSQTPPRNVITKGARKALDLTGLSILVVEDEPFIAMDIIAALEDAGAKVEGPVTSIEDACEVIQSSSFDCALVDANLHGRPVGDIAAALKAKNILFAFSTGYDKDGLPEGFRDRPILSKPSSAEQIVEMAAKLSLN